MTRTALIAAVLSALSLAPASRAADLTVNLHGIRAQTGHLSIAVVDGQSGWDGSARPVRGQRAAPSGETAHLVFKDLPAGDYAVMVTHDENDNGKLDTNLIGMPIEGYGFSNNPKVMRKPTFEEARFSLPDAATAIDIILR